MVGMRTCICALLCVLTFGTLLGNPFDLAMRSQITVHMRYDAMIQHYQSKNWGKLVFASQNLIADFPDSPFAREGHYYLGLAYYKLGEYEYANCAFSDYLRTELSPKFFDEVIHCKFEIAQGFEGGARTRLFGWRRMPKWLSAYEDALAIYDEVITALPRDDLAARSLYRKGALLLRMKKYKASVEAFSTLIRRFPKHALSPEGYLGIAEVYLTQCEDEFADTDRLDLLEVNLRKFRSHFPGDSRIVDVENILLRVKERLAEDLFEVAEFYVRTKKNRPANIYYSTIIKKYPETKVATKSQKRLEKLGLSEMSFDRKDDKKEIIVDTNE